MRKKWAQLPLAQDMGYLIIGQKSIPRLETQINGKQTPAQEIVDESCSKPTTEISFCFTMRRRSRTNRGRASASHRFVAREGIFFRFGDRLTRENPRASDAAAFDARKAGSSRRRIYFWLVSLVPWASLQFSLLELCSLAAAH